MHAHTHLVTCVQSANHFLIFLKVNVQDKLVLTLSACLYLITSCLYCARKILTGQFHSKCHKGLSWLFATLGLKSICRVSGTGATSTLFRSNWWRWLVDETVAQPSSPPIPLPSQLGLTRFACSIRVFGQVLLQRWLRKCVGRFSS